MQIIEPDSGSIRFDPFVMLENRVNRSLLGYLPEERGLYQDVPLMKTLLYLASLRGSDPKETRRRAQKWLERFDLYDRREEKISSLSKGNQQKIQFIASILHRPKLAILGEPFSGFDPINQEVICGIIRELRYEGMTVLLSAHQMQLIERIADRILMLDGGGELLSGTLDEIRHKTVSERKLIVTYEGDVNTGLLDQSPHIRDTGKRKTVSGRSFTGTGPGWFH